MDEFNNQSYLAQLLNPIEQQGALDESRARAEGRAGGLGFQAAMGSQIGLAREGTAARKSATIAGFNERRAGLKRDERLTLEGRAYQSRESQKARDDQSILSRDLAEMGYIAQDKQREASRKSAAQFNAVGFGTGLISAGVGGYFGGLGGAAGKLAGGAIGSYASPDGSFSSQYAQ